MTANTHNHSATSSTTESPACVPSLLWQCSCADARIHQEHGYSPTPGMHDLRHTFAVHCLEAWLRQGKDLWQKLPVLSGYMGHAILKSTEQYLRLVPGRFLKPLSSLQSPNPRARQGQEN